MRRQPSAIEQLADGQLPVADWLCHTEGCLRGRATAGRLSDERREESPVSSGQHAG